MILAMIDAYEIQTSVAIAGTFVCLYYGRSAWVRFNEPVPPSLETIRYDYGQSIELDNISRRCHLDQYQRGKY